MDHPHQDERRGTQARDSESGSRQDSSRDRRAFDPSEPRWTEHLMHAADAFAREMRGVVPDDFSKHARGSLREALMAIRSLIDTGIERLEHEERSKSARKIEVE